MKRHFRNEYPRPIARFLPRAGSAAFALGVAVSLGAAGCLSRPIETLEPATTSTIFEKLGQGSINAIDILLTIDNSGSMADKQDILALAVPDLVEKLVNPRCLYGDGTEATPAPEGPLNLCPKGAHREFEPIVDIHIGIISSSLGGHGGDACKDSEIDTCKNGAANTSGNDRGHLLSRKDACAGDEAATYQDKGFLAWDPKQKLTPAGEHDIEIDSDGDGRALVTDLKDMVIGVGQIGCGYESQLESWYRFLVDPEPYKSIEIVDNRAVPTGIDNELLDQRRDFLRPDSLVAIVLLSDENDCSVRESGQYFYATDLRKPNGTSYHLPAARSECESDPNDPCCKPCTANAPECPADPTCFDDSGNVRTLAAADDPSGLRCFDQKRRFGIDFLYPIDRYTNGLKAPSVPNRAGDLVPNPLFSDLDPSDERKDVRGADRVFFAGIVGVPWQDIARDKADLSKGLKTAEELTEKLPSGGTTWDVILGDPATRTPPADPHMRESIDPRSGMNPITGTPLVQPFNPLTDPLNGAERVIPERDDLQYACTFELLKPRDCRSDEHTSCDCRDESDGIVLCEDTGAGDRMLQTRAKAYPSLRELNLLRDLGPQGIVASVCPSQMDAPEKADFGYRPAIGAIVDRLKEKLQGQCLPRELALDENGQAPCLIVEARHVSETEVASCNQCDAPGRSPAAGQTALLSQVRGDSSYEAAQWNCFCMVDQTMGADKEACQSDTSDAPLNAQTGEAAHGWCYVDATTTPATGNPELVATCNPTERRMVRFVGDDVEQHEKALFIHCDSSGAD